MFMLTRIFHTGEMNSQKISVRPERRSDFVAVSPDKGGLSHRFKTTALTWLAMPVLLLAGSPPLDELVKNSPFGNAPAPGAAGAQSDAQLEFRGVLVDGGETFFSLYDTSTRSSLWVGLNEPGNPFVVESYDEAKGSVSVNFRGRVLSVALKQARIVAMPAAPMPAPGAGGPPAVVAGAPGTVNAVPADEAARLSQIAEEIRRRRALRAQMMQQNANAPVAVPAPRPNSQPPPQNTPRP